MNTIKLIFLYLYATLIGISFLIPFTLIWYIIYLITKFNIIIYFNNVITKINELEKLQQQ